MSHEKATRVEIVFEKGKEIASGELWTGRVKIEGFAQRDASYLAALEHSLIDRTGWEAVLRDETSDPPRAVLRRTRGGEHLWITIEGWPDDVKVTMIHQR